MAKSEGRRRPTSRDGIGWLLEFLARDVDALRPGEMLDLGTDVERYLMGPTSARLSNEDRPLGREVLREFHAGLSAGMEQLESEGLWKVYEHWRQGRRRNRCPGWVLEQQQDGTLTRWWHGDVDAVLLAAASDLVAEWWSELRRCKYEECGAWFLPRHGRQHYHDPKCSAAKRQEKYQPKRNYRAEYNRRLEKAGKLPLKRRRKKGGTK